MGGKCWPGARGERWRMADAVLFEFLHTEMVAELWAPDPDPGSGVSSTPWPWGGEVGCDRAFWQVTAEA